MKRFTIIIASLLMLLSLQANAQNQRILLLESFTNTGCGPCAAYNPAMDALIANNADKIAAINQGEVYEDSLMPYYNVLLHMEMKTIGDIVRMINENKESAYQLALLQLAGTGLDIVAYSVALRP